jgi:hypothetical protein
VAGGSLKTVVVSVVTFVPLTVTQSCFRVTVPVCIKLLDALLRHHRQPKSESEQ